MFCADKNNWVIACEFFTAEGKSSSVSKALGEMIPAQILDSLVLGKARVISAEESLSRTAFELKNQRISLFLQLDAALKTRDSLVLQNLSEQSLKTKIKAEDAKIDELRKKIDDNIQQMKEAEEKAEKASPFAEDRKQLSEKEKYLNLFKGLITTDDSSTKEETVKIYGNGDNPFFKLSASEEEKFSAPEKYTDRDFVKKVQNAGIKALLEGKIRISGDFVFVTSDLYIFPAGKCIATVTEVGNIKDIDFISRSIARSLSPVIASSLPVTVSFKISPPAAEKNISFVIDDVVYNDISHEYVLDSGVHSLRFDAPGFRTVSTGYFFEGNEAYKIEVEMKENRKQELNIRIPVEVPGSLLINGEPSGYLEEGKDTAVVSINDTRLLGIFVGDETGQGFFSVSEKLINSQDTVTVKPVLFDRSEYIDNCRKKMYTSYSVLLVSLMCTMFTQGNYKSRYNALAGSVSSDKLSTEAQIWRIASWACTGISVCAGGWFGYEMTKYFMAADSVLPAEAK